MQWFPKAESMMVRRRRIQEQRNQAPTTQKITTRDDAGKDPCKTCVSRSFFSVCSWFVVNSSVQKSMCLISSAFSFRSCAIM